MNYVKAIPHNSMHGSCRPFPRLFWRRNLEKPPVFLRFLSQNRHINYSAISAHELCGIALNKSNFFNTPAESAVGMPPILRENCVFCCFFA